MLIRFSFLSYTICILYYIQIARITNNWQIVENVWAFYRIYEKKECYCIFLHSHAEHVCEYVLYFRHFQVHITVSLHISHLTWHSIVWEWDKLGRRPTPHHTGDQVYIQIECVYMYTFAARQRAGGLRMATTACTYHSFSGMLHAENSFRYLHKHKEIEMYKGK